jgi:hypothetical protein
MSKTYKFWTAVLAILPFILMVVYIGFVISFMMKALELEGESMTEPQMSALIGMLTLGILMAVTVIAALIFYLIHIVNNKKLDSSERLMWILLVIFMSVIACPIYWYLKILKQDTGVNSGQDFSSQTVTR